MTAEKGIITAKTMAPMKVSKSNSPNEPLVLVIDQGGHASRASVIDRFGNIHNTGTAEINAIHKQNGHIEYDPITMLNSVELAINRAVKEIDIGLIKSAGLATQRSNVLCWHRNSGIPLSPIISWQDRRAEKWLAQKQIDMGWLHNKTGLFMSPHYGASKLHWCLTNIQAVQQAAETGNLAWGPMSSWLTHQLCIERPFLSDAVNASRTLLWTSESNNWSTELIKFFGLESGILPHCVPNQFEFGLLSIQGKYVPLRIVTGDQAAALFANGALNTHQAYITVGTGAFILNPGAARPCYLDGLLHSLVIHNSDSATYALEGTVNGAGSALDFYSQQFSLPNYINDLSQWLDRSKSPPLFINGHAGLGTPHMRASFTSRFIGGGGNEERMVAIIESIVFLLRWNFEIMTTLQPDIIEILIGGGLSRHDAFCQKLADLGLPVTRTSQSETTSHGLAFLLLKELGTGYKNLQLGKNTFSPGSNPGLIKRYQQWRSIMEDALQDD